MDSVTRKDAMSQRQESSSDSHGDAAAASVQPSFSSSGVIGGRPSLYSAASTSYLSSPSPPPPPTKTSTTSSGSSSSSPPVGTSTSPTLHPEFRRLRVRRSFSDQGGAGGGSGGGSGSGSGSGGGLLTGPSAVSTAPPSYSLPRSAIEPSRGDDDEVQSATRTLTQSTTAPPQASAPMPPAPPSTDDRDHHRSSLGPQPSSPSLSSATSSTTAAEHTAVVPRYISPGSLLDVGPPPASPHPSDQEEDPSSYAPASTSSSSWLAPTVAVDESLEDAGLARMHRVEEGEMALPLASPLATSTTSSRGLGISGLSGGISGRSLSSPQAEADESTTLSSGAASALPNFTTTAPTPPTLEPTTVQPFAPPVNANSLLHSSATTTTAAATSSPPRRSTIPAPLFHRRARTPSPPPPPPALPTFGSSRSGSPSSMRGGPVTPVAEATETTVENSFAASPSSSSYAGGAPPPPMLRRSRSRGELYPGRWAASRSQRYQQQQRLRTPTPPKSQTQAPIGSLGSPVVGGGGSRNRGASPRGSFGNNAQDPERPLFTFGGAGGGNAPAADSSHPHYWDSVWPKDLPPVDFNRLPVPAAEIPCPASPVVPIVGGGGGAANSSSHRVTRSTSSLGVAGASGGHARSASSGGGNVLGSSSSAPSSSRDPPSSLHAPYGSSPSSSSSPSLQQAGGRNPPGSPSASPSLIGPTSGAAQRRGSVSMLGPGRSSGGGSTASPHDSASSKASPLQPNSPKLRQTTTTTASSGGSTGGSEAPSPNSAVSVASSSSSSPDEIARRMRNSASAASHLSPPLKSPRTLPWAGSGAFPAGGPSKASSSQSEVAENVSPGDEDIESALAADEIASEDPLNRVDSPPFALPPAVVSADNEATPRQGDRFDTSAEDAQAAQNNQTQSPSNDSASTEGDADDESSPEVKLRHPDLHLDLSEEALQPMNPPRTDKTPTEELDEAMAVPTDVLPAEVAFEDEGLSTLERIFLLSKSDYAFHRSYIARMLGDMLEDVDPCETVEYVIPLLNNFAMDEDETVKEAFATQLHRIMWYYFTTCSLVSVDEEEDDDYEQEELPAADRGTSPRPMPNQNDAATGADVFDDLIARERKASIVSSATSGTPTSMTPSLSLDPATSTVSSGTTVSSLEQPSTSYGFANPFSLDSPAIKLTSAPLIEPPVIAVHIFTPLIGSMLLSQNPAVADPTRAAVVAVLAKMRGAKGLTVDGWELPDRTPGTKTFLSQTGVHAHLSDEIAANNRRKVIRELVHGVILGMGRLESELPEHLLHERQHVPRTTSDESDTMDRRPGLQRTLSRASNTSYASDSRESAFGIEASLFRQQMQQEAALGRAISMNLIASVAEYFSAEELARYGFLQTVLATHNDEPGVKTEAAMALAYLAKVAPDSDVERMLSLFENFVADESEPVRQSACLCLPALCKRIRSSSDRRSYAVRAVFALISSGDLVQFTVLEILGEVIHMFEADGEGPPEELVDIFLSQSTCKTSNADEPIADPITEEQLPQIREFDDLDRAGVSAFNFPAICLSIGKDRWEDLRTTYVALCEIDHPRIVRSMSASIHDLAKILGPTIAAKDLLPRFRLYLTLDDETRERALAHLPVFLANLPPSDAWEILEDIVQAWDSGLARNWRHRETIAQHLPALFAELPVQEERSKVLLHLLQVALLDTFHAVREAAVRGLPSIFVIVRSESKLDNEFTRVLQALRHDEAFKRRKTFIDCVRSLVSRSLHTIDPSLFQSRIFQLLKGIQDDILDVRISLANLFGTICAKDGLYPLVVSRPPELVDMLKKLKDDPSEYVTAPLATVELEDPSPRQAGGGNNPLRLRGGGSSAAGKVFVTVGSTYFDVMIEAVLSRPSLEAIRSAGYDSLRVQYGKGGLPKFEQTTGLKVETVRYVDAFEDAVTDSTLVISHAGSGSILAALRARKPLIVVPNTRLMDNHQLELASRLSDQGYLAVAEPNQLPRVITEVASGLRSFKEFPAFRPEKFSGIVEEVMAGIPSSMR